MDVLVVSSLTLNVDNINRLTVIRDRGRLRQSRGEIERDREKDRQTEIGRQTNR